VARSAEQKREVVAQVRALLAAGSTESEQLDALSPYSVSSRELRGLRSEILTGELEQLNTASADETFLLYKLRMENCVRDLDAIVQRAAAVNPPSAGILAAAVSATKAKSQIIDTVLDRGQSLGVVHKAPKTTLTIGGVLVANASNTELKKLVRQKVVALEQLAERTALRDYLDEPDEPIYYDAEHTADRVTNVIDIASESERPARCKVT